MCYQFIIPEIHIQRQFIIGPFHVESRHVTYYTLHRAVNVDACQQQIWIGLKRITRLLIFIMLGYTLDPGNLTALVSIWIR